MVKIRTIMGVRTKKLNYGLVLAEASRCGSANLWKQDVRCGVEEGRKVDYFAFRLSFGFRVSDAGGFRAAASTASRC